jgi:hypothetical protein
MAIKSAIVNGQKIEFEEENPPTVQELRDKGLINTGQIVVHDTGNGRLKSITKDARIAPNSFVTTVPRFEWGG